MLCPENKAKQRFERPNVRQFCIFATLMSGKQSKTTIRKPKCATVLRFCYQNTAKAIFERQFYILGKKCRFYKVFTCFCDFLASRRRFRAIVAQIYKMKTREALTFLTVRIMKTREALTFLTVFNQKTTKPRGTHAHGVVNLCATLATEISSVSRSHTASHRTHEQNETISRFGVDQRR